MRFALKRFLLAFALFLTASSAQGAAQILSISYVSGDSQIHIGSTVTVNMLVMNPVSTPDGSFTLSLSYVGTGNSFLAFEYPDALLNVGETIYITDGQRTWLYTVPSPEPSTTADPTIKIGDIAIPPAIGGIYTPGAPSTKTGPNVVDYSLIQNLTFRAYKGSGVTGGGGTNFATVDFGVFDSIALTHSALGLWQGVYTVPNLDANYNNAGLFGHFVQGSSPAGNDGLVSPQRITIDGVLPNIKDMAIAIVPNDPRYNGMLYLSKNFSQGTTANHFSNKQARIEFTVNKPNCVVSSSVATAIPKNLNPVPLGTGVTDNTFWNGTDGAGVFQHDGVYTVSLGITDQHGVVGVTKTIDVRVTSLIVDVFNVQLSPPTRSNEPPQPGSPVTVISYQTRLRTDNPSADMWAELENLGWDFHDDSGGFDFDSGTVSKLNPRTGFYPSPYDYKTGLDPQAISFNRIYPLFETEVLRPDGSVLVSFGKDRSGLTDNDSLFLNQVVNNPFFGFPVLPCINGIPATHPAGATATGQVVAYGDNLDGNDWDSAFLSRYLVETGTTLVPSSLIASDSFYWLGNIPDPGSYKIRVRATLTGIDWYFNDPPPTSSLPDLTEQCTPPLGGSTPLEFFPRAVHFFPNARPEAGSDTRGRGLYGEDSSAVFVVSTQAPPSSDGTPPDLIATGPTEGDVVVSGAFGPSVPITAQIADAENQIALGPLGSTIRLFRIGSSGARQAIVGTSQSDGGNDLSAELKFFPAAALSIGGSYEIEVNAVDVVGNSVVYVRAFTVEDQAAPELFQILAITDTNPIGEVIDPFDTQTQGPFSGVREIHAKINIPSTSQNIIDLSNCTVFLRQISPTAQSVPMTVGTHAINTGKTSATLKFSLDVDLTANAIYEVEVISASTNSSGSNVYFGPPGVTSFPRFTVTVPANQFIVPYQFSADPAMIVRLPVTITARDCVTSVPINLTANAASTFLATVPSATSIDSTTPAGFQAITQTADGHHAVAIQFAVAACSGAGYDPYEVTLDFDAALPTKIKMYYRSNEVPAVDHTTFRVKGQNAVGAWFDITSADVTSETNKPGTSRNTVTVDLATPPVTLYRKYAIFYPVAAASGTTPTATPTPRAFNNTRSFNPASSNPLARLARVYYSDIMVADVEVRIFNTAGQRVRTLTVASGDINLNLFDTDPSFGTSAYYFTWDGRNDQGTSVRNGIYLIRYRVVKVDGSEETNTLPVALIQ